jgi:hypothetical protein
MRLNRTDISAYTTGLITSGPSSAAFSRAAADHANHVGSSVKTSSSTQESTKTAIEEVSPSTGEIQNLFSGHLHASLTAKPLHDAAAATDTSELLDEDATISGLGKLYFTAGHQSGTFP